MSEPPSYESLYGSNNSSGSYNGSSSTSRSKRDNNGPPDPATVQPFPKEPTPCNRPRSECPNHAKNYRKMLESLNYRGVKGPAELEYVYSKERGRGGWADAVKADLEELGIWRGMLEHFGALQGPGLLQTEEDDDEGYGGGSEQAYGSGNHGGFSAGGRGGYGSMHGNSQGYSSTSSRAPTSSRASTSSRERHRRGY